MNFILKNWQLKILSVVSAVVLWLFVVGIENTVYVFPGELDVELVNAEDTVGISQSLPKVKVYLRVDKEILNNLSERDFLAQADLKGLTAGEHTVPITVTPKNPQVHIIRVEPSEIEIKLYPILEKEVDVVPVYKGNPAPKYKVGSLTSDIQKATVSAAQTVLDKIENVQAIIVLDGSETTNVSQKVTLSFPELLQIPSETVSVNPAQIVVNAQIVSDVKEKEVNVRVDLTGTEDPAAWQDKITLNPSKIVITGENVGVIESIETEPVDLQTLINERNIETVNLVVPEGVTIKNGETLVSVSILEEETEKDMTAVIGLTGQNSLLKVTKYTPIEIQVKVTGTPDALQNLQSGDVSVDFDISEVKTAGKYKIDESYINIPSGIEIISYFPRDIELEIEEFATI